MRWFQSLFCLIMASNCITAVTLIPNTSPLSSKQYSTSLNAILTLGLDSTEVEIGNAVSIDALKLIERIDELTNVSAHSDTPNSMQVIDSAIFSAVFFDNTTPFTFMFKGPFYCREQIEDASGERVEVDRVCGFNAYSNLDPLITFPVSIRRGEIDGSLIDISDKYYYYFWINLGDSWYTMARKRR